MTDIVEEAVAWAGDVEILVNNAGIIRRTPPDAETFAQDWDQVMAVNATGVMQVTRAFLPQLRATKGRIINLGSIMSVAAGPGIAAYAASKGAVLQLTKALAHDLAPDGIRVNAISPGLMATENAVADLPQEIVDHMVERTQLIHRLGEMDDIVKAMLYLCSADASFVTGETLKVSGGTPLYL
jgi:NAD(P)-dependent dehydrogenase (short-subunit alcohol dehydrogenase family)